MFSHVLSVFSLKNPGRGFLLPCSLSKTRVGGFCCRVRSQKPGSGVFVAVFALKNPGRGFYVAVFSLKNPGRGFYVTVFALKNPGGGFGGSNKRVFPG